MSTRTPSPFTLPLISFPSGDTCQVFENDIDTGSITESPEYDDHVSINLGAESPASILTPAIEDGEKKGAGDDWLRSGIAVHTDVPMRRRSWRSASFSEKKKLNRRASAKVPAAADERDCGICFEVAVAPCRMICCGKVFCLNHISDWLYGSSADGRCPSCRELCSFVQEDTPSTDNKHTDYAQTDSSKPERALILLLLQPPNAKPSSAQPTLSASSSPYKSGLRTDSAKTPAAVAAEKSGTTDSGPSLDPYFLGPCRFHINSSLAVLVGRMVGRVLSIVGLTLVLFVLLT